MFKLQYWMGANANLLIALVTIPVLLIIIYFLKQKSNDELKTYYRNMFQRTAVSTALVILFYFVPTSTLLKIQYHDDPELARLKTLHYLNPANEEYKKQHDAYEMKVDSMKRRNLM